MYTLTLIGGPADLTKIAMATKPSWVYRVPAFNKKVQAAYTSEADAPQINILVASYEVRPLNSYWAPNAFIGVWMGNEEV